MSAPVRNGPKIKKKLAVWERDSWRCRYCGKAVVRAGETQPFDAHDTATVDHVIPLIRGGINAQSNLVTACFRCNIQKGSAVGWTPQDAAPTLADVWPDLSPSERQMFGEGA